MEKNKMIKEFFDKDTKVFACGVLILAIMALSIIGITFVIQVFTTGGLAFAVFILLVILWIVSLIHFLEKMEVNISLKEK